MLGLAKRVGARFLLTSTSEVYGDPLEHPQKEEYWGNVNPIGMDPQLPKCLIQVSDVKACTLGLLNVLFNCQLGTEVNCSLDY